MRKLRLVILAATAAVITVLPASARADAPLRSGTIVSGTGESPGNVWVRGMEGCVGAPPCSAWLQSACNPALAGQEPAVQASIVNVRDLADGATERFLQWDGELGINWGQLTVQFWTGSGRWAACREILDSRLTYRECDHSYYRDCSWRFRIPADAVWMTVNSRPDNTHITWTLR